MKVFEMINTISYGQLQSDYQGKDILIHEQFGFIYIGYGGRVIETWAYPIDQTLTSNTILMKVD